MLFEESVGLVVCVGKSGHVYIFDAHEMEVRKRAKETDENRENSNREAKGNLWGED